MINENLLEEKLVKIDSILQSKYTEMADIGGIAGISGLILFQFYYSKYLDIDKNAEIATQMISYCIDKINNGYSIPTYCNGIAGFAWVIQHLEEQDFIEIDCDELLSRFDDYLYKQMNHDFNNGYYDFLHGALGYVFYFLKRYKNTRNLDLKNRYESYLLKSIQTLEFLSITEGNILKWESTLDTQKQNKGFNLSLSHGISSIINILSRLNKFDVFRNSTTKLIKGGTNYIISFKDNGSKNLSLFPSWIEKDITPGYNSRVAWCYGDLGIGLSLLQASKSVKNTFLKHYAQEILKHTTKRKSFESTKVKDAGICHGSFGNSQIYQNLFDNLQYKKFNEQYNFWMEDGIKKAIHKDGYAGYKQWNTPENKWTLELSLLEGVAGIGLVMIDYLSDKINLWDECLLIS